MSTVWVVAEHAELAWELISGAKTLADGGVTVFVGGGAEETKSAIERGAANAVALPLVGTAMWEDYATQLVERARAEQPSLILVGATKRGRSLAALLAAHLDAPCISDGKDLAMGEGQVTASRTVMGGVATKKVSTSAPIVIVTVSLGVYPASPATAQSSGVMETLEALPSATRVTGRHLKQATKVNLSAAKRVLGVGRGFTDKADLKLAEDLAQALGAELACSRPIAEFFQWMPEERYIGISGQVIKPELYIAAGISGQPQHAFGIREAKILIAVNKDENAPINQLADYVLIGDLKEVLPALTRELSVAK